MPEEVKISSDIPGEKLESLIKFSISSFCSDCVFSFKIFSQLSKL